MVDIHHSGDHLQKYTSQSVANSGLRTDYISFASAFIASFTPSPRAHVSMDCGQSHHPTLHAGQRSASPQLVRRLYHRKQPPIAGATSRFASACRAPKHGPRPTPTVASPRRSRHRPSWRRRRKGGGAWSSWRDHVSERHRTSADVSTDGHDGADRWCR